MTEKYKDLEDLITDAIFDLLLEAKEKGLNLLTFEEVCIMLGVDDLSLLSKMEKGMTFEIHFLFIMHAVLLVFWSSAKMVETPKSASLTMPSLVVRMFPPLISLWMTPLLCRYSRPCSI